MYFVKSLTCHLDNAINFAITYVITNLRKKINVMAHQGEALKLAIRRLGMNQSEAATKLGISRQTLTTYFNRYELPVKAGNDVKSLLGIDLPKAYDYRDTDLILSEFESKYTTPPKPAIPSGENPPSITLHEHNRIIEQKDKLIDQLQETISSLTELLKATRTNPPEPAVQRSGQKTHTG